MTYLAASFAILGLALAVGFAWYERVHPTARVIALVATLAALAALGRIAFAPLPNVKPTTDIVLIAGYVLGGAPGFVVGAVAALASNLFFGQGPWTPWQMAGWGGIGVAGAVLARVAGRELGRVSLAAACAVAGLAFGVVMNLYLWVTFSGDHTMAKLAATFAASLSFDLSHAAGNALFCLAFGPVLVRALSRYRSRFEVTWVPAPAATVGALVLVLVLAVPPAARAADTVRASERYLVRAQNDDGGWGGAPGASSSQLYTGWTALGLAAAGRNPRDMGAVRYIRRHAGELDDLGDMSRTILVLAASGLEPRAGGRYLERELARAQRPDGSFAGRVNTTAFAVMALKAARRPARSRAVRRAVAWLAGQANDDGGFNFAGRGGPSGVDDTGAALQGLAAGGRRHGRAARRAVRFLEDSQASDGGFALIPGGPSNAQSTAWAVQGLLAAGRNPAKVRRAGSRDPMSYLRSLTDESGAVRYSRTSRQTPVWVTAQAVMALTRKPLPLAPVPRERRARPATAPAPAKPQPLPPVRDEKAAAARADVVEPATARDDGAAVRDEPAPVAVVAAPEGAAAAAGVLAALVVASIV